MRHTSVICEKSEVEATFWLREGSANLCRVGKRFPRQIPRLMPRFGEMCYVSWRFLWANTCNQIPKTIFRNVASPQILHLARYIHAFCYIPSILCKQVHKYEQYQSDNVVFCKRIYDAKCGILITRYYM